MTAGGALATGDDRNLKRTGSLGAWRLGMTAGGALATGDDRNLKRTGSLGAWRLGMTAGGALARDGGHLFPDRTVFSTSATSRGAPQDRQSEPSFVTRIVSSMRTPMFHHFGSTPCEFAAM